MSIAEKLVSVAENVPKVYAAGQKSMVDESKIIEKTITGTNILPLDDVSEVPHKLKVQLASKNKIPYPFRLSTETINGVTFTDNGDGTITMNGAATDNAIYYFHFDANKPIALKRGTYTLSGAPIGAAYETYRIGVRYSKDGVVAETGAYNSPKTLEMDSFDVVYIIVRSGQSVENLVFKPQIEYGEKATDFICGITDFSNTTVMVEDKRYTANADGTVDGVKSVSPNMTLVAEGFEITATYNKSYGMQTEYDRFWDLYQDNGNRRDYQTGFAGSGWNNETFKPKHDIIMGNSPRCYDVFRFSKIQGSLTEILHNQEINLILPKGSFFSGTFYGSQFSEINFDVAAGTLSSVFENCINLETLYLTVDENTKFINTNLRKCVALKNLIITGTIGQTGFDAKDCVLLTKDSIIGFMNALSSTTSGLAVTLPLDAVNSDFETGEGLADGSQSQEWEKLVASRSNWTILLA